MGAELFLRNISPSKVAIARCFPKYLFFTVTENICSIATCEEFIFLVQLQNCGLLLFKKTNSTR